jgi:hypothetical protein
MSILVDFHHTHPGMAQSIAVVAKGEPAAIVAGGEKATRCVYYARGAVVHELDVGQTVEQAEDRALVRMWDAYAAQAGGKTFDGKPLPTWAELGEERQACWKAALHAI